jgi:hypothetical protein
MSLFLYVSTCCHWTQYVPLKFCKMPSVDTHIGIIWGGGGKFPFSIFISKNSFFWLLSRRGANKKMEWEWGGKGCMYIKDWFKPIFPLFLNWLILKLNFIIPMVDFAPPPPPVHPMLLAKLCLRIHARNYWFVTGVVYLMYFYHHIRLLIYQNSTLTASDSARKIYW